MKNKNNWIKVHRSILHSDVFDDSEVLKFWIWALCKASYNSREVTVGTQTVLLEPGQFIFRRSESAKELRMTEAKCYRTAKTLAKRAQIDIKSNNRFSVITVLNWGFYQTDSEKVNNKMNSKRTTNEQQSEQPTYYIKRNIKRNIKRIVIYLL